MEHSRHGDRKVTETWSCCGTRGKTQSVKQMSPRATDPVMCPLHLRRQADQGKGWMFSDYLPCPHLTILQDPLCEDGALSTWLLVMETRASLETRPFLGAPIPSLTGPCPPSGFLPPVSLTAPPPASPPSTQHLLLWVLHQPPASCFSHPVSAPPEPHVK